MVKPHDIWILKILIIPGKFNGSADTARRWNQNISLLGIRIFWFVFFKKLSGNKRIRISAKCSNFIKRYISSFWCLFLENAAAHWNRAYFTKLTLFPRRSSSLFICGQDKPARTSGKRNALTLMKGDKVVDGGKKLPNSLLLAVLRRKHIYIVYCCFG